MIIRYTPGIVHQSGQYITTIFNSVGGGWPGGVPAPDVTQTISPSSLVIAISGSHVFTTNEPASWSSLHGTLVVSGDGLSATYTAPGIAEADSVTVANLDNPGNTATASITVSGFGPLTGGDASINAFASSRASRSFVGSVH